ncbi:SseB family protein [Micromonospora sp. NPDC051543]|uniref:SseB family protein n=1 Tax=Micromonospora sp. NPDC051543 TaxID=3364287 RepID=UPI0037B82A9B
MSETPLSDVMSEHAEAKTPESYERFLRLFRSSTVGIVATGVDAHGAQVQFADGNLGAGSTTHGDGRTRLLAYADPEAALRNFGPRFNAGVSGEVLLQMAATDPDCEGVLVNSAIYEISLVISKSAAESLLTPTTTRAPGRRPWCKRR